MLLYIVSGLSLPLLLPIRSFRYKSLEWILILAVLPDFVFSWRGT